MNTPPELGMDHADLDFHLKVLPQILRFLKNVKKCHSQHWTLFMILELNFKGASPHKTCEKLIEKRVFIEGKNYHNSV